MRMGGDGHQLTSVSHAKRVLVKEVNWLGDLVLSLPALRVLREAFPTATLSVSVREGLVGFFDGMEWVDEVISYRMRSGVGSWFDQRKIIAAIRSRRFDLAVILPNSFRSALWLALAGVPRRAGYATNGRRFLLTESARPKVCAMQSHQSFYWLGMLADTLGISAAGALSAFHPLEISQRSVTRAREWLVAHRKHQNVPLIAVSPAAAYGPAKEWPSTHYAELIELLHENAGAECILVGTAAERSRCEQIAVMSRTGAIVAAGDTCIAELKAMLSLCDGFVGNDSGVMHLAAALGIPTIGIFGSTDPDRTGPAGPKAAVIYHRIRCSPCLQRTCRFGHYQCLSEVQPAEVAAELSRVRAFSSPLSS